MRVLLLAAGLTLLFPALRDWLLAQSGVPRP